MTWSALLSQASRDSPASPVGKGLACAPGTMAVALKYMLIDHFFLAALPKVLTLDDMVCTPLIQFMMI